MKEIIEKKNIWMEKNFVVLIVIKEWKFGKI